MASEVYNQRAIRLVMFNDTSKTRLICGTCACIFQSTWGPFYVVINEKGSNKAFSPVADPPRAAVLVNHSKQLEIFSKGIISGSGAFGP